MAKKAPEIAICPCWAGRWKENKVAGGGNPTWTLRCDYCDREFETQSRAPFEHEKYGAAVGKHYELDKEPK